MSEQIIFEYEAAQTHLNEMNVPTTKGLAELSLWGRVSAALDEKDSRIAALEADKKRLERVRIIASQIFDAVNSGVIVRNANPCPHGNFATAPNNHPWFCDDCWNALKDALSEVS